jgi:hypothetical protein
MRRSNLVIASVISCAAVLLAFPLRPAIAGALATAESILTCSREDACMKVSNTGVGVGIVGSTEKLDGVRGEVHNGDGIPYSLVAGVAGVDTGDSLHATNGVSGLSNNGNGGYFRTLKGLNALIAESRNFNLQTEGHSTVLIMDQTTPCRSS